MFSPTIPIFSNHLPLEQSGFQFSNLEFFHQLPIFFQLDIILPTPISLRTRPFSYVEIN